ncbi:MAG: RagB/SusD family nutrient uptake outer membrane protein [Bacteroidales bacterium]
MKNRAKIFWITALFAGSILTLGSCSDYLDKMPENQLPVDDTDYTITSNAYKQVVGIYGLAGQRFTAWGSLGFIAVRGDDTEKGGALNDQAEFRDLHNFNYTSVPTFWVNNETWKGLYRIVMSSNLAIEALDKYSAYASAADKAKIEIYKGEVRFLRAYSYFILARTYGGVPVFTDNKSPEATVKRPHQEVIRFIISECEQISEILPALRPVNAEHKGAATKYSALALQAKAASDILDYDVMLKATNSIIESGEFGLFPDYYNLFKKSGELSQENLFELQYTFQGSETGDSFVSDNYWAFQGPGVGANFKSVKKFGANNEQNMEGGWGFLPVNKKLSDFMSSRNESVRYQTLVLPTSGMFDQNNNSCFITLSNDTLYPGGEGSPTQYNGKAYLPSQELVRSLYGGDKNIIMIRYADILLLNAEARISTGGNGDQQINMVRERAGMPAITGATIDDLIDERYVELGCEYGERYYDLVRTGKAITVLANQGNGYTADKRFYPIPQEQVDLNPSLGN